MLLGVASPLILSFNISNELHKFEKNCIVILNVSCYMRHTIFLYQWVVFFIQLKFLSENVDDLDEQIYVVFGIRSII